MITIKKYSLLAAMCLLLAGFVTACGNGETEQEGTMDGQEQMHENGEHMHENGEYDHMHEGEDTMDHGGGEMMERKADPNPEHAGMSYYCPMKCEGQKTYTKPGSCPVCGMDLEKKEKNS